MDNEKPGLKKLRSNKGLTCTAPTPGSKTQQRKANLQSYNVHQRKFGLNGVSK